ncbi:histidine phosphatase family protein [Thalassotalea sp. 1_MG-2023]|uniref:histidine phosphatase family protein n=1 Tax=Thalassotalea sp. 1_MG-2023 TaxID=3062680 RepID=UPI0026E1FD27|nr:histidine phosphatase family protein [Thalassotalea sp. 1_MG-2023]MDO6427017.1 histidine phosphatase family protein [Thalassotalea sp. 1_MG-2023]
MANVILLRHGKVQGQAALYGTTDVAVSDDENQQLVRQFKAYEQKRAGKCSHVISSPLIRCKTLAIELTQALSLPAPSIEPAMQEMYFGRYDGIAFDDIYQQVEQWQPLEKFWRDPVQHPLPEAELLTGFSYRVNQAWQAIVQQASQQQDDLLVVCHGGVIRMILAAVLNLNVRNPLWYTQLSIGYGSLTKIHIKAHQCRVKYIARPMHEHSLDNSASLPDFIMEAR